MQFFRLVFQLSYSNNLIRLEIANYRNTSLPTCPVPDMSQVHSPACTRMRNPFDGITKPPAAFGVDENRFFNDDWSTFNVILKLLLN